MALGGNDFNAIRISLASPEQIRVWSYGEVTKPETINYRTLRPEKDGLFCERIFGPTKDWECYCGKYKKIRFKGVFCDRCGVEVARAKVRRERMGHISLAAPVAHIWFSKGTPSRLGLLLDLSPRNLDRVLYFAQYLVTDVDEDYVLELIDKTNDDLDDGLRKIEEEGERRIEAMRAEIESLLGSLGERRRAAFTEWREDRDPEIYALGEREEEDRRRAVKNSLDAERERNKTLRDELASLRARRAKAVRERVTHYSALGVPTGAAPAEIAAAYRTRTMPLDIERKRGKALRDELAYLRAWRAKAVRERVTHYSALGVPTGAAPAEIAAAYRTRSMLYHPDRNKDDVDGANERMKAVNLAYQILTSAEKRRQYDALIARELAAALAPFDAEIANVAASLAESHAAIAGLERDRAENERMKAVNLAYRVLTNAEMREQYDALIAHGLADALRLFDARIAGVRVSLADSHAAITGLERDLADAAEMMAFVEIEESIMVLEGNIRDAEIQIDDDKSELENSLEDQISELESLAVGDLLTESRCREMRDSYPGAFKAAMGAEAVLEVLKGIDLDTLRDSLQDEMQTTSGQRRKKAIKRMRVVEAFRKSGNMAEWMILTALPVLPPELRPMVQLDGGRFATSDLNDLYRRVINRNNRLKRLMDLGAPEIIVRNEKRMLQEAVDALVDNGRRGRAVAGSHNHRLKSLSDLLRGKQGRFRQNLLGKRVDYSGRSVIIAGPELKLHQCGLPRRMALELFKPFVMNRLVMKGYAHNIKSAKRMAERISPEVWDILEEAVGERPVLLNRAPTLHRLGIQAFEPVLIDGGAIQLHPLVCAAFNADFDGDQMAVHVPLSSEAVMEARQLMLSTFNMLSPSSGEPIVAPTLDIALGAYYMTMVDAKARGAGRKFGGFDDARLSHELGAIDLRASIEVKVNRPLTVIEDDGERDASDEWLKTTVGRVIFNDTLPESDAMPFYNIEIEKGALKDISDRVYKVLDQDSQGTADVLDNIKTLGFEYATKSGITIAINDIEVPHEKAAIVGDAEEKVKELEDQLMFGLITDNELYRNSVDIWSGANDELTGIIESNIGNYGGIQLMASSGAKGNIAQVKQMAGMRGLMAGPRGRIINRPIKANFREGLSVLEYFISTHGARKGLTDTALNTASSGYLTRRLIDVAQEIIILSEDCGTENGVWIRKADIVEGGAPFVDQIKTRYLAEPVADPNTGEVLFDRNEALDEDAANRLEAAGVVDVNVRSPMTCEAPRGICQKCYGLSLATLRDSMIGEAVGIMAAQSIGEPGTQLTMRTFHTGGVASEQDITSGLPRVEELFEARVPKMAAVLSEIDGEVEIEETIEGRSIRVSSVEEYEDEYVLPAGFAPVVEDGAEVRYLETLAEPDGSVEIDDEALALAGEDVTARASGTAYVNGDRVTIKSTDTDLREYVDIPAVARISARTGETVIAGQALTDGPKNPQEILRIEGKDAVQRYLIDEVQKVYRLQGVPIHSKHLELIISQMLRKVKIDAPGDTELMPDEYMDRRKYEEANANVLAEGGEPATATPILLGITRASLNTDSFLAAASFQETTRVLTESAVNGQIDQLRGLKENVIIGRLIPARLNPSEDGVSGLSLEEANAAPVGMGHMTTGAKGPAYPPTIVPAHPDPEYDDPDFDEFDDETMEPDEAPFEEIALPSDDD